MPAKYTLEIGLGTMIKITLFILGLFLLYQVLNIVGALLVAVVIASAIEPMIRWAISYRVPRALAVIFFYITILISLMLAFYIIIPIIAENLRDLIAGLPSLIEEVIKALNERFALLPLDLILPGVRELTSRLDVYLGEGIFELLTVATNVFGGAFSLVLVVVISFYLAVQENGIANFLRMISHEDYEEYVVDVWSRSQRKIGRWLQGQLLLGFIVGSLVYIGLTLLGIQHALMLALLSAVFELIPFFGPIMAAVPGIAVATLQEPLLGIFVLGLYVAVQQMENHLIYPVVVRKMTGIPPLIAILALIAGGSLAGFFGFILAIPLMVILIELLNDYAVRKKVFK